MDDAVIRSKFLDDLKGAIDMVFCTSGDLAQTCWYNPELSHG